MLKVLEALRKEKTRHLDLERKARFGQFMTPASLAAFMASLFDERDLADVRLLDAGAGLGSLSTAFVFEFRKWNAKKSRLNVDAFEIDDFLRTELEKLLLSLANTENFSFTVLKEDFLEEASHRILFGEPEIYDFAILNPPYKKINSDSRHRSILRSVRIETVNLYSAFVALAIRLLKRNGQLVAIIPRSFCNGPYYKSFREQIFRETAIRRIHLFESRSKAFKDDNVLQENVIIHLQKGVPQADVTVSTSTDASFADLATSTHSFGRVLYEDDSERVIHVPTSPELDFYETTNAFQHHLSDLFIEVSTGPVVDFRVREHTLAIPQEASVPLLYPGHFEGNVLNWPKANWKKPNAIILNTKTECWLYPSGFYTVVRRFSSKEEFRRIRAMVFSPSFLPNYEWIGFENHFNVFHFRKQGIDSNVAYGLAAFLNSTRVDKYFRRMNGHTQVNATDLRRLKYPSLETLSQLGEAARGGDVTDQSWADALLNSIIKNA